MDAGDFSDSDAEYGAIDDDQKGFFIDGSNDAHHQTSKESIVFLVDCSPSNRRPMSTNYFQTNSTRFRKEEDEEENNAKKTKTHERKERSYVHVALDAYRNVLRDRVVASPEDEIGLILYNTKERRGELEFDNVFVVHEIAPITAERVGEISNYIDTGEFGEMLFDEQIGTFQSGGGEGGEENNDDNNNAINHALWTASHMLSRNGKTRRSAYAFTCDDEVFTKRQDEDDVRGETTTMTTNTPEKKKMMMMTTNKRNQKKTTKEATIARCEEMANAGIKFELFPGPKVGDDGCVVVLDAKSSAALACVNVLVARLGTHRCVVHAFCRELAFPRPAEAARRPGVLEVGDVRFCPRKAPRNPRILQRDLLLGSLSVDGLRAAPRRRRPLGVGPGGGLGACLRARPR